MIDISAVCVLVKEREGVGDRARERLCVIERMCVCLCVSMYLNDFLGVCYGYKRMPYDEAIYFGIGTFILP